MLNEVAPPANSQDTQTNNGRGMLIVVSSPSGGGKGTLIDRVLQTVAGVSYSVSYTTRAPRAGEHDGREYFFVEKTEFEAMIERREFLEWANVYGSLYGTHRDQVNRERAAGKDIILEIDVQGAASIRGLIADAVSVFILPPSFEMLRRRLTARATDSPSLSLQDQGGRIASRRRMRVCHTPISPLKLILMPHRLPKDWKSKCE